MREMFWDAQNQAQAASGWDSQMVPDISFCPQTTPEVKSASLDYFAEQLNLIKENGWRLLPDRCIDPSIRHLLYMETGLTSTDKIKGLISVGNIEK